MGGKLERKGLFDVGLEVLLRFCEAGKVVEMGAMPRR